MFRSSHFSFLFFGHFWRRSYQNMKILLLQGKMGITKKRKENHATKVTKISKNKIYEYNEMNKTLVTKLQIPGIGGITL